MTSPRFPEPPPSIPPTPIADVDKALERLRARKDAWAQTGIADRLRCLEKVRDLIQVEAEPWARTIAQLKGVDPNDTLAGEDWLAGPMPTARNVRLFIDALKQNGQPKPPALRQRDGQWIAEVFPTNLEEKLAFTGWRAEVWIEPGKPPSQGRIYREKQSTGRVALVLGAGNVSSIAPLDVLYKLFVENEVCVLKMNPVNEVAGPFIERIFKPLIDDGFVAVV
jgi:hypothetical protein